MGLGAKRVRQGAFDMPGFYPLYNGRMSTLFIADLHLDPERPAITGLFGRFIDEEARGADALYILGDLFEAWVGDDDPSATGTFVADKLRGLADSGVPVYFMRGNRDFLLGDAFARRAGMTVLPDPALVTLYGKPTLLMHGDLLCTDDTAYQQFRTQTRDPAWQAGFLAQPLPARLAFAQQARAASKAHQGGLAARACCAKASRAGSGCDRNRACHAGSRVCARNCW